MFLDELWALIKRNMLVIVIAITLVVAMPWLLIFIVPIAALFILLFAALWRVRSTNKKIFEEAQRQAGGQQHSQGSWGRKRKSEGEVTVVQTEQAEQRINDEVGEYVDFKEIKDNQKK